MIDDDGNGATQMNYGLDLPLAVAIMNKDNWKQLYNNLPSDVKANATPVAYRLCSILVAGSIAETIHRLGRKYVGRADVELSGPDLQHALSVSTHFQIDLRKLIGQLYEVFKLDPIWRTIMSLSKALIRKRKLTRAEIDDVIAKTKFLKYLETFNDQPAAGKDTR